MNKTNYSMPRNPIVYDNAKELYALSNERNELLETVERLTAEIKRMRSLVFFAVIMLVFSMTIIALFLFSAL